MDQLLFIKINLGKLLHRKNTLYKKETKGEVSDPSWFPEAGIRVLETITGMFAEPFVTLCLKKGYFEFIVIFKHENF